MQLWSLKMADCVIKGRPALADKWAYDNGVVLKGLINVWRITNDYKYFDFCREFMDRFIYDGGLIRDYRPYDYNLDLINNGKILFELYKQTKNDKYKRAAFKLRRQFYKHPRTSEGVFWHKKIYPYQIWLDGLYMGMPFYIEFINCFERDKKYSDITKQFFVCYKNLRDKKTGLLYHAWDESRRQFWCDKKTGLSKNFWGRSMGWFVMAIVDVLTFLPKNNRDRKQLVEILRECLKALAKVQDKSGCWYQVLDKGGKKGNYLEASCSCMILYAAVKAYKQGYIKGDEWREMIDNAFNGIIDEFVLITEDGFINLNKNCSGAGLGNKEKRDGSYAYYISEPVICNDLKGVGAFILAMLEYENLRPPV